MKELAIQFKPYETTQQFFADTLLFSNTTSSPIRAIFAKFIEAQDFSLKNLTLSPRPLALLSKNTQTGTAFKMICLSHSQDSPTSCAGFDENHQLLYTIKTHKEAWKETLPQSDQSRTFSKLEQPVLIREILERQKQNLPEEPLHTDSSREGEDDLLKTRIITLGSVGLCILIGVALLARATITGEAIWGGPFFIPKDGGIFK